MSVWLQTDAIKQHHKSANVRLAPLNDSRNVSHMLAHVYSNALKHWCISEDKCIQTFSSMVRYMHHLWHLRQEKTPPFYANACFLVLCFFPACVHEAFIFPMGKISPLFLFWLKKNCIFLTDSYDNDWNIESEAIQIYQEF